MAAPPSTIRPGTPGDDAVCLQVIRAGFATVAEELGFTAATHPRFPAYWSAERFARARGREGQLLVAEAGGVVVGCCFAGPGPDGDGWVLNRLAVLPTARHRGIGAGLVRAAAGEAVRHRAGSLGLSIVAANHRLGRWYHELGFELVSTTRPETLPFDVAEYRLHLCRGS
ncbi:MAG: GNAT family N-acetyltransferase [Propionicimonas sp.]|nr:GNAT family N-acetyltransferase [Propionicimonas sp.]